MLTSRLSRAVAKPTQNLAKSTQRRHASHGSSFNEPSGHMFGEKPLAPGQKRPKEGWETIWYAGMMGGLGFAAIIYLYKPDTTIQTWALEEAQKRLTERGETLEYERS